MGRTILFCRASAGTVRWNVEIGVKVFVGGNHQRRTEDGACELFILPLRHMSNFPIWTMEKNLPLSLCLPCHASGSQGAREIAPRQIHELAGKEVRTLLPLHIDI